MLQSREMLAFFGVISANCFTVSSVSFFNIDHRQPVLKSVCYADLMRTAFVHHTVHHEEYIRY